MFKFLTSRRFWLIVIAVLLNGIPAAVGFLGPTWQIVLNGIIVILGGLSAQYPRA